MKFELLIDVQSTGDGKLSATAQGLREVKAAADGTAPSLGSTNTAFGTAAEVTEHVASSVAKLAVEVLALAGAYKALEAVKDSIATGLAYNSMLEQQRLGIAATYATFTQMTDARGRDLDTLQRYNAAMPIAVDLQQKLRTAALGTTLQYSQLSQVMSVAMPFMMRLHDAQGNVLGTQQIVNLITQFSQGAYSFSGGTMDANEIATNLRYAITGGANSRTARFASALESDLGQGAGTKAKLQQIEAEGKGYDYLIGRLGAYGQAGKDAMNTYAGAMSNLKDAWEQLTGEGTSGLGREMTKNLLDLRDELVQVDAKGKLVFNESLVKSISMVADAVASITKAGIGLVDEFVKTGGVLDTLRLYREEQSADWDQKTAGPKRWWNAASNWTQDKADATEGFVGRMLDDPNDALWHHSFLNNDPLVNAVGQGPAIRTGHQTPSTPWYQKDPLAVAGAYYWNMMFDDGDATPAAPRAHRDTLGVFGPQQLAGHAFTGYDSPIGPEAKLTIKSPPQPEDEKALAAQQALNALLDRESETMARIVTTARDKANLAAADLEVTEAATNAEKAHAEYVKSVAQAELDDHKTRLQIAKDETSNLDQLSKMKRVDTSGAERKFKADANAAREALTSQTTTAEELAKVKEEDALYKDNLATRQEIQKTVNESAITAQKQYDLDQASAEQSRAAAALESAITTEQKKQAEYASMLADDDMRRVQLKQQLADLDRQAAAAIQNVVQKYHLTDSGLNQDGTINSDANAAIDKINETLLLNRQTAMDKADRDETDSHLKHVQAMLEKERALWDGMYQAVASTATRTFQNLLQGTATGADIKNFATSISSVLAQNLMQPLNDWFHQLAVDASGAPTKNAQGNLVYPGVDTQNRAKGIYTGIAVAADAYSLYSGASSRTRTQNAEMGISSGASIGGITGNPYAAAIGAIVGLIAGLAAPSSKANEYYVQLHNGQAGVQVGGGAHDWQGVDAQRNINAAIETARQQAQGIIDAFPQSVFDKLNNTTLDTSLNGGFTFRYSGSDQALQNFITTTVPQMVFDAALPVVQKGFAALGVSDPKWTQLSNYAKSLDPTKGMDFFTQYAGATSTIADDKSYFGYSSDAKLNMATHDASAIGQLDKANEQVDRLALNFDKLTLPEQVSRAQQIAQVMDQARQTELQYLQQIQAAQQSVSESIRKDIMGIDLDQAKDDPDKQVGILLADERRLRDQLQNASSPDEVARIAAEMEQDVQQVYQIEGGTSEAAKQAKSILTDVDVLSNTKFSQFTADEKERADKMQATASSILDTLTTGVPVIVDDPNNDDNNNDDNNDDEGGKKGRHIHDLDVSIGAFGDSATSFGAASSTFGASVDKFALLFGGDQGSRAGKTSQPIIVNVSMDGPSVQITPQGDASAFISSYAVQIAKAVAPVTVQLINQANRARAPL